MKNSEIEIGGRYTAKVSDKLTTVAIRAARPGGGWDAVNLATGKSVVIKSAQRLRKRVAGGDEHKPVHVGKVTRGDGQRVTVTVPPKEREAEAATDAPAPEIVIFRNSHAGAYRWRLGDSVSAKQYMAREQAERAALKANPGATIRYEAPAPKGKKARQEHETPSAKEVANDAHNEAFARSEKKAPKMSRSAARAEGAARQKRERKTPNAKRDADPKKKRVSLLDAAAVVLKDAKAPLQAKQIVERVIERGLWTPGAGRTPHATLYAAMTREIATKGKDARFTKVDRGQFASGGAAGKGA